MNPHTLRASAALSAVVLAFGCETSSDNQSGTWQNSNNQQTAQATPAQTTANQTSASAGTSSSSQGSAKSSESAGSQTASANNQSSASQSAIATRSLAVPNESSSTSATSTGEGDAGVAPDEIGYGSLSWRYGGIGGGGYKPTGVSISGLKANSGGLSFKYNTNLSAWGYAPGDCGAYACMFVQTESGSWVGGKFDWISSSRSSRDFKNVYSGYAGWNLDNVPNPCQIAFVILDANAKRRSNVIVGTWKR